ncbi:MAG: polysaccharide deacetylase family protein [Myxococcota bacterium]
MAQICLSFDNGPDPVVTPHVLDVLDRHGVTAWFFVLGHRLAEPGGLDLARQIRDAGHRLGNHSYSHQTPLGDDRRPDAVEQELARTDALLDRVGVNARTFRPFGGGGKLGPHLLSPQAVEYLTARGHTCVLWNVVPGDWLDADGWVDAALRQIGDHDHALVVLHDILPDAMAHLDDFLTALKTRGHTLTAELPVDCLPIIAGTPQVDLSPYVQAAST